MPITKSKYLEKWQVWVVKTAKNSDVALNFLSM